MGRRAKIAVRAVAFSAVAAALLGVCGFVVQPTWNNGNYNPTYGFYEEPANTIETLFLGGSHVYRGISPTQLYEDYGICAYDQCTDAQPTLASYYWLQETYRLHAETLDTVVFDVSMLRSAATHSAYHKSIDPMHFSMVKINAVRAYSRDPVEFVSNMIPAMSYHDRWKELSKSDYIRHAHGPMSCLRGYYYSARQVVSEVSDVSELHTPLLVLNEEEPAAELNETEVFYFGEMVSFCEEHDIRLVLFKTPTGWTSADHNAVQELADAYGLDFVDLNIEPAYSAMAYNFAYDSYDADLRMNIHANYYGATKITDYMGRYLTEVCDNRDVRGDETYAFMEEEQEAYDRFTAFRQSLTWGTDPCDYVEAALAEGDKIIFLSVKGDAATALTEAQRDYFASIGLTELSRITAGASYLAVIDDGDVLVEQMRPDPGGGDHAMDDPLRYEGKLRDGTVYALASGGDYMGDQSSIVIGDHNRSLNERGLNIAIYDCRQQEYIESASFDTGTAPERPVPIWEDDWKILLEEGASPSELTGENRILYLYDQECEEILHTIRRGT